MLFVNSTSFSATNTSSILATYPGAVAGNLLIAKMSAVQIGDTPTLTVLTPTDTNGPWTDVGSPNPVHDASNAVWVTAVIAYEANCTSGSHPVRYTFPGATNFAELVIEEYSGMATSSPLDKLAVTSAIGVTVTTMTTGSTATLSSASEMVAANVALFAPTGAANAGISDPPTTYTSTHAQQNTAATIGAEEAFKFVSATTPVDVQWTWTDTTIRDWVALIATFQAGAGGTSSAFDEDCRWYTVIQQY